MIEHVHPAPACSKPQQCTENEKESKEASGASDCRQSIALRDEDLNFTAEQTQSERRTPAARRQHGREHGAEHAGAGAASDAPPRRRAHLPQLPGMGGRKRRRKGHTANAGKAGAGAPASFLDGTAYRRAEKAYRRYTHDGAPETDFGDVIDCRNLDNNTEQNRRRLQRVAVSTAIESDAVLYTLDGCPGLYLAPSVLSEHEQCELVHSATNSYQRPPNATNLTAVQQREPAFIKPEPEPEPEPEPGLQALTLGRLSRLRWATLGYQYQWTSRTYEAGKVTEMPSRLSELCSSVARAAGHAMEPQAAIVNYYNPKVIRPATLRSLAATHVILCAALTC
eukprot:COSAG02_NODE_1900_length_10458_cov_4.285838_5_plen_338_part_00